METACGGKTHCQGTAADNEVRTIYGEINRNR